MRSQLVMLETAACFLFLFFFLSMKNLEITYLTEALVRLEIRSSIILMSCYSV